MALLGIIVLFPFRKLIRRLKLTSASIVFTLAAAVYLAVAVFDPQRINNSTDPLSWWTNRAAVAALLFALVRIIDRLLIVPMFTRGGSTQAPRFIHQVILILLSIFVVLMYGKNAFGWPIGDFLTGGAVISIVIGLALQESLGNLFSGLMLQAAPPFVLGDFIAAGPVEGRVVDMSWRSVTLHTVDDNYVVIPNGSIAKQEIINFNAPSSTTARLVRIGLECDLPPCDAMEVLRRAAVETTGVAAAPPPIVVMLDFADSSIVYGIKFWITEPHRHLKIEHEVRLHAWYRLREKGYHIPSPIRMVEYVSLASKHRQAAKDELAIRQKAISAVPLLELLSLDQHRQLAAGATIVRLAPGQILFNQDDPGETLYVIRQGHAEIMIRAGEGRQSVVATLGPGDVFGEMSALTGQPRTATIRAADALSLVAIDKTDLRQIIDADASVLEKFSEMIARRNVHRDDHQKNLTADTDAGQAINVQQQSLLGRMMSFFAMK